MKEIEKVKKKIVPILKRNNVVKAGLFSFVRGEVKKSDIERDTKTLYKRISQKEKARILETIEEYFKKLKFVKGVIVFGSFIKRKYFRDIDIAIITDKRLDVDELIEIDLELEKKIGFEINVRCFNDFNDALKFEVLRYGKILFVENEEFVSYRYDYVKRYLDFLEWWKKWI